MGLFRIVTSFAKASQRDAPVTSEQPRPKGLTWINSGEIVGVAGHEISSGLFYMTGEARSAEGAAISTCLPVSSQPAAGEEAALGYWSQYDRITPSQRTAYLRWLADGRNDPSPETRDFGYLFLFFYGIERRLLVDRQVDQAILEELSRLLRIYGPYRRSKSLPSYFCDLLHFWGYSHGVHYYSKLWPWIRSLPNQYTSPDSMALILANLFAKQQPIPGDVVYDVISADPNSKRSVVIKRANEEFRALFTQRYLESTDGGLVPQIAKRERIVEYAPASPSLVPYIHSENTCSHFYHRIPNVLGIGSQFKKLHRVWEACISDLGTYSRTLGKGDEEDLTIKAYLAMPEELRTRYQHPLADRWEKLLFSLHAVSATAMVSVSDLATLLEIEERPKLTAKQGRDLADVVQTLDFAMEPDPRFSGGTLSWDEKVIVYRPLNLDSVAPSPSYHAAAALYQLCLLIAAADGSIDPEEMVTFRDFIESNLSLSPFDRQRLFMLGRLLLQDPAAISRSLGRIVKKIPKGKREAVANVLVYIAAADGVVTKDEMRTLKRVFRSFDFAPDLLDKMLHRVKPEDSDVTVSPSEAGKPGESIPPAEVEEEEEFRLDMALVARISDETRDVIAILADVMAEPVDNVVEESDIPSPIEESPKLVLAWLSDLDEKLQPLVARVVTQSEWSKADFSALSAKYGLMPLAVFDGVNEWADDALGDFLLSGEDPIVVDQNLIPKEN